MSVAPAQSMKGHFSDQGPSQSCFQVTQYQGKPCLEQWSGPPEWSPGSVFNRDLGRPFRTPWVRVRDPRIAGSAREKRLTRTPGRAAERSLALRTGERPCGRSSIAGREVLGPTERRGERYPFPLSPRPPACLVGTAADGGRENPQRGMRRRATELRGQSAWERAGARGSGERAPETSH
ncbi:hypothetical protein NDU88_006487 [Pleurodeles waltl]|uniref:Uncharacterized protein n=1 Tax=Pleurodeles waltl TaxID=8319 RepID=A0AAV7QHR2_PLEWA|nr:hypothetical protein NDU88_006487 [Pleurodeles waltl]